MEIYKYRTADIKRIKLPNIFEYTFRYLFWQLCGNLLSTGSYHMYIREAIVMLILILPLTVKKRRLVVYIYTKNLLKSKAGATCEESCCDLDIMDVL